MVSYKQRKGDSVWQSESPYTWNIAVTAITLVKTIIICMVVCMLLHHPRRLPPWPCGVAHGLSVELSLRLDDIVEFGGRQDSQEAGMVVGLQLLDFYLQLVDFHDGLLAPLLIHGFHALEFAYLVIKHALLIVQLVIEREECRCLMGRETRLKGDELLQVGLEFFRVEFHRSLGRKGQCHQDEEHERKP